MTTHAGIPVLVWLVKVAVLLALGRAAVAQPVFSTVTVENSPGDVGQYTSLGVDKNGRVQISYYDATTGKLKVARMPADGSWEIQVVDEVGDVGLYTSLFVYPPDDPLTPSVSYYRADSEQLKVTCFESSWQTLPGLSARIEVCKATALAVVRGMPIVAYVDTDQRALKLAIYSDNQWKEEPAAPVSLPPDLAMAYNRDEEPRIVYADGSELWLAWKDCDGKCLDLTQPAWPTGVGPWHFEAIHLSDPEPRGGIDCVSVAVRPDDRVYVAYCDGHLKCATGTRTGLATWEWDVHVVDESDFLWESDCSIALGPGPDFVPHLCYSTSGSGLKYVRLDQIAYDRATARFYVDVTVTNSSDPGPAICIPLWLVAEGVAPGYATLVAADGVTSDGDPYLDLSTLLGDGRLDPGESVTRRVYFRGAAWVPTNIDPGLSVYGVVCYTTPFP